MMLKVQQKPHLFIYNGKEMGILLVLAVLVAIFAFTLGVHLGKRVGPKSVESEANPPGIAATEEDKVPSAQDLTDQHKGAQVGAEDVLDKAAREEVGKSGLKLNVPRQVDLPRQSKAEKHEKTAKHDEGKAEKPAAGSTEIAENASLDSLAAIRRVPPAGKYTLQIGSHPKVEAARDQIAQVEGLGLQPYLRVVEIQGRGRWYRLYFGGFSTRDAAEKAGQEYRSKGLIESYIVANAVK